MPRNLKYKRSETGRMKEKVFSKLAEMMEQKPWRDPLIISGGCDGVAWEIRQYSADGKVVNTSGKIGYIYGHRVLEDIVKLLPRDGKSYAANAYVTIEKLH